jgi:hypothetical protein
VQSSEGLFHSVMSCLYHGRRNFKSVSSNTITVNTEKLASIHENIDMERESTPSRLEHFV